MAPVSVIIVGIDPTANSISSMPTEQIAKVHKAVEEMEHAIKDHQNLNATFYYINPKADNTREAWVEVLSSKKWDCISIGGGVRLFMEHTDLFEFLVNTAREKSSETVLTFPDHPNAVLKRIEMHFP